jgi:NAD(P)H dehydrogenase (quinone)
VRRRLQANIDEARMRLVRETLGARLDALFSDEPIRYRKQNAGDYAIPALTLRDEVAGGQSGFAARIA